MFPAVSTAASAIADQVAERCPFLSHTLNEATPCRKAVNSRGVCTISASSNGPRQDWLVCPYRALDDSLLTATLSRAAFDIAPAKAVEHAGGTDAVISAIVRRLGFFIPGVNVRS